MRRSALEEVSGWDAHNVTEDADLSFRLAAMGHRIGYIHPPTQEEAVSILEDWKKQRSRWIKGYMQTWAVHMRHPLAPGGIQGWIRFFTLQFTLGITLLSILFYTPVVIALPAIGLVLWAANVPIYVGITYGLTFAFSISIGCLIGIVGAHLRGINDSRLSPKFQRKDRIPSGASALDDNCLGLNQRGLHDHRSYREFTGV